MYPSDNSSAPTIPAKLLSAPDGVPGTIGAGAGEAIEGSQGAVLTAVLAVLRSELGLSERNCFETLEPMSPIAIPPGGDYFLTVALGEGRFDEPQQIGGGEVTCYERASVTVTAYNRVKLDAGERAAKRLRETTRGLLVVKRRILKALVGRQLLDGEGQPLLGQLIPAVQAWRPRYDPESQLAMLAVAFGTDFVWDLET